MPSTWLGRQALTRMLWGLGQRRQPHCADLTQNWKRKIYPEVLWFIPSERVLNVLCCLFMHIVFSLVFLFGVKEEYGGKWGSFTKCVFSVKWQGKNGLTDNSTNKYMSKTFSVEKVDMINNAVLVNMFFQEFFY